MISDLDHCEAGKACKLEINRRNGGAPGDWPHPWFRPIVKQFTPARRRLR
jgi:hypothetical protein